MKADQRFAGKPLEFWAHVRSVTERVGYSVRNERRVKAASSAEVVEALKKLNLRSDHVAGADGQPTGFGVELLSYFEYRAYILNSYVEGRLMNGPRAAEVYSELCQKLQAEAKDVPVNKQSGEKKTINYLTAIVNLLVASEIGELACNFKPRALTTITRDGKPFRTLSRWLDGAFPSIVNPVATWEIKEYYHTTSFGSKVSDAVYVAQLDGMELQELRAVGHVAPLHYLMVDAHDNWWDDGKSYLCRLIDMLHMGYAEEVLFGFEVVERLPQLVRDWLRIVQDRDRDLHVEGVTVPGAGAEPKAPAGPLDTETDGEG